MPAKGQQGFQKGHDPSRNMDGANSFKKRMEKTKPEIGMDEMQLILRRLKPLSKIALTKLGIILESGTETAQMRAIVLVLDKYKDLLQQLYIHADDKDDVAADILLPATVTPLFSMTMLPAVEK